MPRVYQDGMIREIDQVLFHVNRKTTRVAHH